MGADFDAVQAAIVLATAMVFAGGNRTMDATIGLFHNRILLSMVFAANVFATAVSMPALTHIMQTAAQRYIPILSILQ